MITTSFKSIATVIALGMSLAACDGNQQTGPVGTDESISSSLQKTSEATTLAGEAANTLLAATLKATTRDPLASGTAAWESLPDRITFTCEVEDVTTTGDHEVKVNGVSVGFVNVVAGLGDLNLDTHKGDIVPTMIIGDRVEVRNPSGRVILKGRLR